MSDPLLRVENLGKRFGRGGSFIAVQDVNLTVEAGETLGLVGESGCGKSTLARMVVGLARPSAGNVFLKGRALWNGKGSKLSAELERLLPRMVQMVFQDPYGSLNPRMSIGSSVREPLDVQRMGTRQERRRRVMELLDQVGVASRDASRFPHQFSGGQRQRVAIARALALRPELLVCDEPVSALDVSIQAQILNLLLDLQESLGLAYLFISHDLAVVGHMSDRIAVMRQGRLVELGPARELMDAPLHPYTRQLLDAAETLAATPAVCRAAPSPASRAAGGCPFLAQCPDAGDPASPCANEFPAWREAATGRMVACHLAGA